MEQAHNNGEPPTPDGYDGTPEPGLKISAVELLNVIGEQAVEIRVLRQQLQQLQQLYARTTTQ